MGDDAEDASAGRAAPEHGDSLSLSQGTPRLPRPHACRTHRVELQRIRRVVESPAEDAAHEHEGERHFPPPEGTVLALHAGSMEPPPSVRNVLSGEQRGGLACRQSSPETQGDSMTNCSTPRSVISVTALTL
jgi:hypothetical protein